MAYEKQNFLDNAFKSTQMKRNMDVQDRSALEDRNRFQQNFSFKNKVESRIQQAQDKSDALAAMREQRAQNQDDRSEEKFEFEMTQKEELWDRDEARRELVERTNTEKLSNFDKFAKTRARKDEYDKEQELLASENRMIDAKQTKENQLASNELQISEQKVRQEAANLKLKTKDAREKYVEAKLEVDTLKLEFDKTTDPIKRRELQVRAIKAEEKIIDAVFEPKDIDAIRNDISNNERNVQDFITGVRALRVEKDPVKREILRQQLEAVFNDEDDTVQGKIDINGNIDINGRVVPLNDAFLNKLQKGSLAASQAKKKTEIIDKQVKTLRKPLEIYDGKTPEKVTKQSLSNYARKMKDLAPFEKLRIPPKDANEMKKFIDDANNKEANYATLQIIHNLKFKEEKPNANDVQKWIEATENPDNKASKALKDQAKELLNEYKSTRTDDAAKTLKKYPQAQVIEGEAEGNKDKFLSWDEKKTETADKFIEEVGDIDNPKRDSVFASGEQDTLGQELSKNYTEATAKAGPNDVILFDRDRQIFVIKPKGNAFDMFGQVGGLIKDIGLTSRVGGRYTGKEFVVVHDPKSLKLSKGMNKYLNEMKSKK